LNLSGQLEAPAALPQGKAAIVEFVTGGRGADLLFHVPEYTEK